MDKVHSSTRGTRQLDLCSKCNSKVRILLDCHDRRLDEVCKRMTDMLISWDVLKISSRTSTCSRIFVATHSLSYRHCRFLRVGHRSRTQICFGCYNLLLWKGRSNCSTRLMMKMVEEFIQVYIIYRFIVPDTIKVNEGQSFKNTVLY